MDKGFVWIVAVYALLGGTGSAMAQNARVLVTPLMEVGSYNRTHLDEAPSEDLRSTSLESGTIQKGFLAEIRTGERWSTKLRFTTGSIGRPNRRSMYADGRTDVEPYNVSDNAVVGFAGSSRSLEISQEYTRGAFTYRVGLAYRRLGHTDFTTVFNNDGTELYSESEFADSYFGPRLGITARHAVGRLTATASFDIQPWMYRSATYEFRLRNWGDSLYEGSTSSRGMDVDLGLSYRLMNNLGVTGGWRYSGAHTGDSVFLLANPYGSDLRQRDSWKAVYVGLQIIG